MYTYTYMNIYRHILIYMYIYISVYKYVYMRPEGLSGIWGPMIGAPPCPKSYLKRKLNQNFLAMKVTAQHVLYQ